MNRLWEALVGGALILLGVLFLANNLGVIQIDFGRVWGLLWPLLLVMVGVSIVWGSRQSYGGAVTFGHVRIGDGPWELADMDMRSGMGEVHLDLTTARIPDGEHTLRVHLWMGSIRIVVPRDLALTAQGKVTLGSLHLLGRKAEGGFRELSYTSPDYPTASRRVRLDTGVFIGEVVVT